MNQADGKMFGKGKGMKAHKLFDIDGAQVHVWHNNTDLVIAKPEVLNLLK